MNHGPKPDGGHQVLADLLCHLDEFIRCRDTNIASLFISFLGQRGHPAWQADAIINELCFTAARYRRMADHEARVSAYDLPCRGRYG